MDRGAVGDKVIGTNREVGCDVFRIGEKGMIAGKKWEGRWGEDGRER